MVKILKMLQATHICACEMTSILKFAASTVSRHLRILRDSDFVFENKNGKLINFQINPITSDKRIPVILSSLDFWIADDEAIIADKEKVKTIDRYEVCST